MHFLLDPEPTTSMGHNTTLIIVICVLVAVIVVVVVVDYLRFRRFSGQLRSNKHQPEDGLKMSVYGYDNPEWRERKSSTYNETYDDDAKGDTASVGTYEDVGLPPWLNSWIIPWRKMSMGTTVLGNGLFGEVLLGTVTKDGEFVKVAVKQLQPNATPSSSQRFMEQFRILDQIGSHPNIVNIVAAFHHEDVLSVAIEYFPNGDLRSYLRKARASEGESPLRLSSKKLVRLALDVAKGMQHVAASGVIHRRLAARSILLDEKLVAKISGFGLAKYEDVVVDKSKGRIPPRWLSLESLKSKKYTSKNDVWSFGVLLWEIATMGATPYPGIKSQSLVTRIENGYRMPKPTNCDDEIYELMLHCWQENPEDRPHFKKLAFALQEMAASRNDQKYIRLPRKSDGHTYLNIRPDQDDN